MASDAGIRGVHEIPAYSVTKAGVVAVSELFAAEGAPFGIRANAVCPGDVVPGIQATPAGHADHAENPDGVDASAIRPVRNRRGRGVARRLARVRRVVPHDRRHAAGSTAAMGATMSAQTRSA